MAMKGIPVLDRIGALFGVAWFVLGFVGNTLATSGASGAAHPTGEQVLADLEHGTGSGTATLGFSMELLSFALFAVFLAYLYGLLHRAEGRNGWLAGLVLTAGITQLAAKLGSAAVIGAAVVNRHELSPQLARVLNDTNAAAFVFSWLPFGVFVAGAAAAMLHSRVVGRGFGWTGLLLGAASVAAVLAAGSDLLSANPIPFLLAGAWLLVISIRLAIRRPLVTDPVPAAPAPQATVPTVV
jgi:hypothetical protein